MNAVPPTTAVKRNRAHNVDTDRLAERRDFLLVHVLPDFAGSRMDFAVRAYELQAIENVLEDRDWLAPSDRGTVRGNVRVDSLAV